MDWSLPPKKRAQNGENSRKPRVAERAAMRGDNCVELLGQLRPTTKPSRTERVGAGLGWHVGISSARNFHEAASDGPLQVVGDQFMLKL
jgi:hypothetical protein